MSMLRDTAEDTSLRERAGLFVWLWRRYLSRHWKLLIVAAIFMVIEGSMFGALSYMMKPMFDRIFVGGNPDLIVWVAAIVFGIFLTRAIASISQKVILTRISQQSVADVRADLVAHLMRLDGAFHQTYGPGYLMQRVNGDVDSISKVWRALITGAGRDVIALISLFSVAFVIDWRWTLVALLGVPFLLFPALVLQRFTRGASRKARDQNAQISKRLNEILHGIVPIKLNTLEKYHERSYRRETRDLIGMQVRSAAGQAMLPGLIDVMSGVGFVGVLLFGASEILAGDKTVGDFMAFFTAIGLAFEPLRRLGAITGVLQVAAAGLERLKELFDLRPVLSDPDTPVAPPEGVPEITLIGVSAHYGDSTVLDDVTLKAEAGRVTAFVGPSGAGKSTIFNLLTRLHDPTSGSVEIGGVPVGAMRLKDLRALYSVVSQDALLFDETLRENVVLDNRDVSEDRLSAALDAAHVTDFLPRLSRGLEAPVGPRGSNLSGGQRQRVAIARALLRNTPILLLDEATSALDAQAEAEVQAALDALTEGRTTLVIAHRLSTIRNADKIIVLDQGQIVDEGTHDELIGRPGVYANLWRLQSDASEAAE
ncbi:ABC transporter ATP-binding protein [Litorisediminicola beolgyonensis]|uniref:ABC transporter ATP-binding protein n=1 Tax=Litorisediminicola beolgyonensis TaxID=1173614 RepID=A0ABW3ZFD4_9RHOB